MQRSFNSIIEDLVKNVRKISIGKYETLDCLSYQDECDCGLLLLFDSKLAVKIPIIHYDKFEYSEMIKLYNIIDIIFSVECDDFIDYVLPEIKYIGIKQLGYQYYDGKGLVYLSGKI